MPNQKQIEDKVAQILSNPKPIAHQKFEKLVNHWNIELREESKKVILDTADLSAMEKKHFNGVNN